MTSALRRDDIILIDEGSLRAGVLLEQFGNEILEASFPPEEYVPGQYSGIASPEGPLLLACGPGGRVLGGACGEIYQKSDTLLLAYLAVRQDVRGAGIGTVIMDAVRERWLHHQKLALLEIEDPRYHASRADYGDPAARVRFYARYGVRGLSIPYFQPRLRPELNRRYHLILSTLAVADELRVGAGLVGRHVEGFLREYFASCEGDDRPEDGELESLLITCHPGELAMVPLEELVSTPPP